MKTIKEKEDDGLDGFVKVRRSLRTSSGFERLPIFFNDGGTLQENIRVTAVLTFENTG
ncbi:MAG: hypothetical protein KIS77_16375 [Saprospiraceae bacterium]|nr:hypothetical protein [Saprospiraceae bacterium]